MRSVQHCLIHNTLLSPPEIEIERTARWSETRVAVPRGKPAEWLFSQEKATLNTSGKGTFTLVSL
jgi:hypothetical protein